MFPEHATEPSTCLDFSGGAVVRPFSRRNFMQGMSGLLALPLLRTEEPESVLYNGNIWTEDETQPRAQAVAIGGGGFFAVGSKPPALPLAAARKPKIDLAFKISVPRFTHPPAHPFAT